MWRGVVAPQAASGSAPRPISAPRGGVVAGQPAGHGTLRGRALERGVVEPGERVAAGAAVRAGAVGAAEAERVRVARVRGGEAVERELAGVVGGAAQRFPGEG